MKNFYYYLKDSVHELKLVTWPTQERLLQMTATTVIFVLIMAFFLGLADFGLNKAYTWLLSING